ncbi:MAG: lipopolysaccharide biosynthesis protein [Alphaproteobacteria bacterium]
MIKRVRKYLDGEDLLRKFLKNGTILFTGGLLASVFAIAVTAITARGLGVEQFGLLTLVVAYVKFIDKLVDFETWKVIIKYGADDLEKKNHENFLSLIKLGVFLDVASSVVGVILSVGSVFLIAPLMGWPEELVKYVSVYSFIILFNWSSTPIAILRLFDRYINLTVQQNIMSLFKLIAVTIVFFMDGEVMHYLFAWMIGEILGRLCLFIFGMFELSRSNIGKFRSVSIKNIRKKYKGIISFIITANLDYSVRNTKNIDIFIISALLSLEAVGVYKIARDISKLLQKIKSPFIQSIYPELSRLRANNNKIDFKKLLFQTSLILGSVVTLVFVCFVILGKTLIYYVFGTEFLQSYDVSVLCLLGMTVSAFVQFTPSALLSLGRYKVSFYNQIISVLLYLPLTYVTTKYYGIIGAGASFLGFHVIWSMLMLRSLISSLRRDSFK